MLGRHHNDRATEQHSHLRACVWSAHLPSVRSCAQLGTGSRDLPGPGRCSATDGQPRPWFGSLNKTFPLTPESYYQSYKESRCWGKDTALRGGRTSHPTCSSNFPGMDRSAFLAQVEVFRELGNQNQTSKMTCGPAGIYPYPWRPSLPLRRPNVPPPRYIPLPFLLFFPFLLLQSPNANHAVFAGHGVHSVNPSTRVRGRQTSVGSKQGQAAQWEDIIYNNSCCIRWPPGTFLTLHRQIGNVRNDRTA